MSEEKIRMLKLMRFWLFGIFIIIAAVVIMMGFFIPGLRGELFYWLGLLFTAVLCFVWYFVYKAWIGRKGE